MPVDIALAAHAAGLIVVYSTYGVLQERIMRGTYGPDNLRFTSSSLLILVNRLFSISTALVILALRRRGKGATAPGESIAARLKPASPYLAYAAVAGLNFLSTTAQYEALKYVTYTTQSLAKCAKMLPVLVVGALVHKKKYAVSEWVAGGVILLGCAVYLFSQPPRVSSRVRAPPADASAVSALLGTLCLSAYLFFDGLVSTTQERVFGKNPSSANPFGPESPVLDQMIWTNLFAAGIAVGSLVLASATGNVAADLHLLFTSPALAWDVCAFSAASAIGLAILLNTIASFGALTTSLIMTIRQFLSIIINAGIFGNFRSVGLVGWMGVAWVASGIYIKTNSKRHSSSLPKSSPAGEKASSARFPRHQYVVQYVVPVVLPIFAAMFIHPFSSHSSTTSLQLGIQGGQWDAELHAAVAPKCEHTFRATLYETPIRTAFASYPRSGNSYMRSVMERATGFQTGSRYCDSGLLETFLAECNNTNNFFVKTHYPSIPLELPPNDEDRYKEYDQVFHLIRNPIDAVASWWHLSYTKLLDGHVDHEGKVELESKVFESYDRPRLIEYAKRWRNHALYWTQAPIRTHTMRYEDLRTDPIPQMMSLLPFLLPPEDRPSLERIACLAETSTSHEPYKSRKSTAFAAWNTYSPQLRMEVLYITRRPFCAFGYDRLLREQLGDLPELKGFCDKVHFVGGADGFYADTTRIEDEFDEAE